MAGQANTGDQHNILKDFARKAFHSGRYQDALNFYLDALKLLQAGAYVTANSTAAAAAAQHVAAVDKDDDDDDKSDGTSSNAAASVGANPAVTAKDHNQQQLPSTAAAAAAASGGPPELAIICSNISATLLKLNRPQEALEYATAAVVAAPRAKALYRQANALMDLQQYREAVPVLEKLIRQIGQGSAEAAAVNARLHEAVSRSTAADQHQAVQSGLRAAHVAWATTTAREAVGRNALLQQLQQGMSGYAWDPQDWEWRPTWLPDLRSAAVSANIGHVINPTAAAASSSSSNSNADIQNANTSSRDLIALKQEEVDNARSFNSVTNSVIKGLSSAFSDQQQQQQYVHLLSDLTTRLADLESPQRGYALLHDVSLLHWYEDNLTAAAAKVAAGQQQLTILVLANGGGGVLGLLAAAAAAAAAAATDCDGRVYVIERSRWGYKAARQLLESNRQQQQQQQRGLVDMIELVPVPLSRCYYVDPQQQQQQQQEGENAQQGAAAGSSGQNASLHYQLHHQADILVTDLFDYSVLGQGLLPSLSAAAAANLLSPDVLLLPDQLVIHGQLLHSASNTPITSGFNIQDINKYRWHPTIEKISHTCDQLDDGSFTAASDHFKLMQLDLKQYVKQQRDGSSSGSSSSSDSGVVCVDLHRSCDSMVIWFDLINSNDQININDGKRQISTRSSMPRSGSHRSSTAASSSSSRDHDDDQTADQVPLNNSHSTCLGLGLYYLDQPISLLGCDSSNIQHIPSLTAATTRQQQQQQRLKVSTSIVGQQRLIISVTPSSSSSSDDVTLSESLSSLWSWSPVGLPRHAYLPRWHFDMLADDSRNEAYDKAIRREIARLRDLGRQREPESGIHVLDIGTGTGLLAMMAARAGADAVTAVESVRHLAETATDIVALNGYDDRIKILHKDGRYLKVGKQEENADMTRQADLLVFEVFDCGLIGEGALHIVAAAKSSLLRSGAKILPSRAKVFCQPIQYQRQLPKSLTNIFDPSALYPYRWQPDYFEVNLKTSNISPPCSPAHTDNSSSSCSPALAETQVENAETSDADEHSSWLALAAPQLVFEFDFNTPEPLTAFLPASKDLTFQIQQAGLLNAVAFWFELQLDEDTTISSSPYVQAQEQNGSSSTTWKQAVQLLPEHAAAVGDQLILTARHDTYAISFSVCSDDSNTAAPIISNSTAQHISATNGTINSSRKPASAAHWTQHQQQVASSSSKANCVDHEMQGAAAVAEAQCSHATLHRTPANGTKGTSQIVTSGAEYSSSSSRPQPTGVPLFDPLWRAAYDSLSQLQGHLVKSITQDPLEYRKCVTAAMMLTMQPWGMTAAADDAGNAAQHVTAAAAAAAAGDTGAMQQTPQVVETGGLNSESVDSSGAGGGASTVARTASGDKASAGLAAMRDHGQRPAADAHHAAALLTRLMS